jgi:hypothetical protein
LLLGGMACRRAATALVYAGLIHCFTEGITFCRTWRGPDR